jgi:hypothetical protein
MTTSLRLAAPAAFATAALALAGNAFATQTIAVSQSASSLTIKVAQDQTDPQPAKIIIYLPAGYTLNPAQAPGTTIGTTSGHVFARDLNIPLPLSGNVLALDPALHTMDPCSPGVHVAVWDLHLTVAGQAIDLPVYVSQTTGTETALGAAKLEVCLGPSDVPVGTPGRSPNGAQLLDATFTVNNTITPPSGASRVTSLWTPWGSGTGMPNPAGTVEARAFAGSGSATISARVTNRKKKLVRISGRAIQSGIGAAGAKVGLLINSRMRFSTKTSANGGYAFRLQNTRRAVSTTFFQVKVSAPVRDITATGCATPTFSAIPCVSATAGPFTATSKKIRLKL